MYRNVFQKDFLTVLNADGPNPFRQWQTHVRYGFITRLWDDDLSAMAIETLSTNVTNCYLESKDELGVSMPFLVLAIKNLKKYFTFHVTILDDGGLRRRFRFSNFQTKPCIGVFDCSFPLCLNDETPWNLVRIDLRRLTLQAFQTTYLETYKISIHANCRVRRVYFCKILLEDHELPKEYSIQPRERTKTQRRVKKSSPEKVESPTGPPPTPSQYQEGEESDAEAEGEDLLTQASEEEEESVALPAEEDRTPRPPPSAPSEEEGEGDFTLTLEPPEADLTDNEFEDKVEEPAEQAENVEETPVAAEREETEEPVEAEKEAEEPAEAQND